MRRILPLLAAIALICLATGCARQHTAQTPGTRSAGANVADGATASGQEIYQQNCVVCHGKTGDQIPDWKSEVKKMSQEQVEARIRKGGGGMPAFADKLSDAEVKAVAAYAKELAAKS